MYDVRSWLSPCMVGSIKGHTRPHHFEFTRNNVGKVTIYTKGQQGSSWIALNSSFSKQILVVMCVFLKAFQKLK